MPFEYNDINKHLNSFSGCYLRLKVRILICYHQLCFVLNTRLYIYFKKFAK